MDAVFARGFRGPESRGSGLGLSIARTLVRQQGGELELRRGVTGTSSGASFVLSLPVVTPAEVVAAS
jgi:signal transduction histidine kinase